MVAHRMRNKILSINNDLGNKVEDPKRVKECVIKFHKKMFGNQVCCEKRGWGHHEELDQS